VWQSPKEMEAIGVISSQTANFHYQGCEKSALEASQRLYVSVVDAGDLLVFPPNWGHSVLTQAGPNVMLNMRETALRQSLFERPLRFLETLWAFAVLERKPHSTTHYNKLQMQMYQEREAYYRSPEWTPPESGCKEVLKQLLNK
jgi:hypothetical protein